ncbi:hypothetical protein BHE74_00010002 [Ensete ventricosum]|nr:hypothetical protein BHE74_00010002 [Ensete ventricosum]RZR80070.1 hypothetical protein BHM03_00005980 [Ensete ventricosum]
MTKARNEYLGRNRTRGSPRVPRGWKADNSGRRRRRRLLGSPRRSTPFRPRQTMGVRARRGSSRRTAGLVEDDAIGGQLVHQVNRLVAGLAFLLCACEVESHILFPNRFDSSTSNADGWITNTSPKPNREATIRDLSAIGRSRRR